MSEETSDILNGFSGGWIKIAVLVILVGGEAFIGYMVKNSDSDMHKHIDELFEQDTKIHEKIYSQEIEIEELEESVDDLMLEIEKLKIRLGDG